MQDFAGFDADAPDALRALPDWTKDDRAADQDAYDHLVESTKRFAQAVGDRVRETGSDTVSVGHADENRLRRRRGVRRGRPRALAGRRGR